MRNPARCLVWLPHSYSGRGPAESCVRIIESFAAQGIETTLFVSRARAEVPSSVSVVEAAGGVLRRLPYRLVMAASKVRLTQLFKKAVDGASKGTIAYFWPDVPGELVGYAKARGMICVREMINSPLANAKPLLDAAYHDAQLPPAHGLTDAMVADETAEIALHDFVFSSNAEVDRSLSEIGVPEDRILSSSFGWVKRRFASGSGLDTQAGQLREEGGARFRAVFVGLINVRKGVPVLLDAWARAEIDGELLLAGTVEPAIQPLVDSHCAAGRVRCLGQVGNVGAVYRSCDAFVFPTHEEGGPQVTYEAAACGAPVITTPMGAARLVRHGETGLICAAGNPSDLADQLKRLASDDALGPRLAQAAREEVAQFEYAHVGRERAIALKQVA